MQSSGKRQEIVLKFICSALFLFAFGLFGWSLFFIGLFLVSVFWFLFNYNSTQWILRSLDLGPEIISLDKFLLKQKLTQLAERNELRSPKTFLIKNSAPVVMGFGSKKDPYIVVSEDFFSKLSVAEQGALLELTLIKLETGFCKNIEFSTLLNLSLLFISSKLDLVLAFIIGLKRKNKLVKRFNVLFTRFILIFIRIINYFYVNQKLFFNYDELAFQNNPHLVLAFKKTLLYSPFRKDSIEILLCAFNFCNLPDHAKWHKALQIQPELKERVARLQKDKNLMTESLSV